MLNVTIPEDFWTSFQDSSQKYGKVSSYQLDFGFLGRQAVKNSEIHFPQMVANRQRAGQPRRGPVGRLSGPLPGTGVDSIDFAFGVHRRKPLRHRCAGRRAGGRQRGFAFAQIAPFHITQ